MVSKELEMFFESEKRVPLSDWKGSEKREVRALGSI